MAQVRVRKRGKTFSYVFEAGKKEDGKRKVVEKGGFATKKLAYDAGVAAYTDWKHGNIGIVSDNVTLKDFLQNWIDNVVALNVKPTTMQNYKSIIKKNILPYLGNIAVQNLTPAILDEWVRGLQKSGYSKSTLSKFHAVIHHALDYAVYPAELISSNTSNYIKVPKKVPNNIVKRYIINPENLTELLEKYPFGSPYYIPILILFYTGMRISEVCGLTLNDIDFVKNVITLKKQIVYVSRKGHYFSTLKTESSNRFIVIDEFLANELRRWQKQQAENEQSAGDSYVYAYSDSENKIIQQSKGLGEVDAEKISLICTKNNGQIIFKYAVCTILKSEGINSHSFRHTHATTLTENGATPKGVAGRLGHSTTSITQNLYTHNTEKLQIDTAKIFSKTMQTNSQCRQQADKIIENACNYKS